MAACESIKRFADLDLIDGLIEAPQDTTQSEGVGLGGYNDITGRF